MKLKLSRSYFYLIGFGALIWFLIRVIPKPSRATYPCQRAAFPIASAFVIYLTSLVVSSYAFLKFKKHLRAGNNSIALIFLIITALSSLFILQSDKPYTYADNRYVSENQNEPIGTGKGIFPGRVVWIHDSTAVDQQLTNLTGDYWWMDSNVDQTIVNSMISKVLKSLTGKGTDAEAWDAIFRYYNQTHNRGDIGYTAGEKIVIKINLNNGTAGDQYIRTNNISIDTSPQVVYAILDQLINIAGVNQSDISFGDPGRNVDNIFWNKFYSQFPDVKYWGNGSGRTPIEHSVSKVFFSSDGKLQHYLPRCYVDATYMINIPLFKQHHRAGISLTAKNHIGTFVPFTPDWNVRDSLHHSFPSSEGNGVVNNGGYNLYRLMVDFMGHKDLGGKTILFLVDGLWSSTNWGDPPWKWRTAPFNNKYPASIFASLDAVALESVGFDFLFNEFYIGNPSGNYFPHYSGVDDFLHQAADSVNWATGILYDPEDDGLYLPRSMGVHEHWNNANDMQYSRNLGADEGIELVKLSLLPMPATPILISPIDSVNNTEVEFIWTSSYPEIDRYWFEIDTTNQFTTSFVDSVITDTIYNFSNLENSKDYWWRVKAHNSLGWGDFSNVGMFSVIITSVDEDKLLPLVFSLEQNFPNPFNPSTTIKYSIPERSQVVIEVFDLLGREIETLINEVKSAGGYIIEFNATDLPSGVYFYQLKAGEFIETKKMLLIR